MEAFFPDEMPVAVKTDRLEVRAREAGEMALTFYRFREGADLREFFHGLRDDRCQCPHWAYVMSGRLRIHTADGPHEVRAGQAFHVEPGHAPEALEDTEMFEVSPIRPLREVGEHLLRQLADAPAIR
jgi:hypothetical protein